MLDTVQVIGTDLHSSAYKRFGGLRHGQCYGAILRLDDPDSFNPDNIVGIADVVPHILASHKMLPLEIARHATPTGNKAAIPMSAHGPFTSASLFQTEG